MRIPPTSLLLAIGLAVAGLGCSSTPAQAACAPDNCDGCCNLEGVCQPGTTAAVCGEGGGACSVCIASQSCARGGCALLPEDAGVDGGVEPDAGSGPDGGWEPDGGFAADGGSGQDAGVEPDGGSPAGAIGAPSETWTWVDFPDSACGNGATTGLGVNLTSASNEVFIYLEGGGACWDALTCFVIRSASNLSTGYGSAQFAANPFRNAFAVDRGQPANPFRAMSFVYIPYCTGDVHAGDAVRTYGNNPPVHHKGARNVEAFLARLVPTFPAATRIFLSGSSAGGFGTQLNYERFVTAFPGAEIHLLSDSGQMVTPAADRLTLWLSAWNFTLPPACPNCTTDFTLFPEYLTTTYPARRFALTAYEQDGVLRNFFGYDGPNFQAATWGLLTQRYAPYDNARYFLLSGSEHTMLGSLGTLAAPGGTTLNNWITRWVNGDPSWSDVSPQP